MEGLKSESPFVSFAAEALQEDFVLLDVGASGGIDTGWRSIGARLRAFGFDPNVEDCERQNSAEAGKPGAVEYVPGFVECPPEHPFLQREPVLDLDPTAAVIKGLWGRNPWQRLSVQRATENREALIRASSSEDLQTQNQWHRVDLSDPLAPIHLPRFLAERDVRSVDFIKIDIDGHDFEVLNSLDDQFETLQVLGAGLEVNFIGGIQPWHHTFHNTDRFMRARGYDLFNLTTRQYSNAYLPSPFLERYPSKTATGRPVQGDAAYILDVVAPHNADRTLSVDKLLKLSMVFALFGHPDMAAELLVERMDDFAERLDVEAALDLLAAEAQPGAERPLSYREYMARFAEDSPMFYP